MLSVLACVLALQVPLEQPPRLRTILPNGSAVLVERMPGATTLSVQLFVGCRGVRDTPQTHGLRHLIEHLSARGKGDLDHRLETAGAFLYAKTLRDATIYEIRCGPKDLKLAMDSLREILRLPEVTDDMVKKEAQILGEEGAIRDRLTLESEEAWTSAYADQGLSPFGNLDVIKNATPDMIKKLVRAEMVGPNLAVTVAGNVDLDEATKLASEIIAYAPLAPNLKDEVRPLDLPVVVGDNYRAVKVPRYSDAETAWNLAACLAVASDMEDGYVTYTPVARNGLIVFGSAEGRSSLDTTLKNADPVTLFARGRSMARRWVANQLFDPGGIAYFRGLLLVQDHVVKPESLLENLTTMTYPQFRATLQRLTGGAQ